MCLGRHSITSSKVVIAFYVSQIQRGAAEIAMTKFLGSSIIIFMGLTVMAAGVMVVVYG
jgi:hypothetical protein